ncbi:subclass B3 metallo-beta-lactamase [Tsuneonella deserti]|uniref:subclass B3 metallo-beta-lactamase n=1 Tax=Tsuneonella deserti TaxID=2035528 RepID=UPI001E41C734|nr:subclass B3 metallo-beta-lactamase [Tsuneonella deserti]
MPAPQLADAAPGQRAWAQACDEFDEWDKPGPPFRVYGDTYYVGTCGITALLVTSRKGHVLIDSGTEKGAEIVLANIRSLGFDPRDVKALLMSHEHFDHVGGMARLQAATGAPVFASPEAAAVLRTGLPGGSDPQAASGHPAFPPVSGPIHDVAFEMPMLASRRFQPIITPGHTPGATSWTWPSCEGTTCKQIVYADSLSAISADGYRFSDHPAYLAGFRRGIARIAAAPCDIVLAPHPSAADMRGRLLGHRAISNPAGCREYAARVGSTLDKRLADETTGG